MIKQGLVVVVKVKSSKRVLGAELLSLLNRNNI